MDALVGAVKSSLRKDEMVTLVGFGTFYAGKRAARTGRNPRTGEALEIKAGSRPKFRVLSSAGRASLLHGECRRFDPVSTHQIGAQEAALKAVRSKKER